MHSDLECDTPGSAKKNQLIFPIRDFSEHSCPLMARAPCKCCILTRSCPIHIQHALPGRKGLSAGGALHQRLQQGLGLLKVGRVQALGKPAVDRRRQLVGISVLTLLLLQSTQAHSGPQLIGPGLLAASNAQGLLEASFCPGRLRDGLAQEEFGLEPIPFRQELPPLAGLYRLQRLCQQAQLLRLPAAIPAVRP
jgi:hypothetical protein